MGLCLVGTGGLFIAFSKTADGKKFAEIFTGSHDRALSTFGEESLWNGEAFCVNVSVRSNGRIGK